MSRAETLGASLRETGSCPPGQALLHGPDAARFDPARKVAALYVETNGCYFGLPGVDPWDAARDARTYSGPHPVVAHPPCERWGRMWFGAPVKPDRQKFRLGDDNGCFDAALAAVRKYGGVLEHPEASKAWDHAGLNKPPRSGGWVVADFYGGWTCYVEQGHYGHAGRKGTWLYAHSTDLPSLKWGHSGQRLDPIAVERYGYLRARRSGITGRIGGKFKKEARAATPPAFRDLLLSIARTAIAAGSGTVETVKHGSVRSKPERPAKTGIAQSLDT